MMQNLVWLLIAGPLYGLAITTAFQKEALPFFQMVSASYLVLMPFAIGAFSVYVQANKNSLSLKKQIFLPWIPIIMVLAGSIITAMEGSICVIIATPIFLIMGSIGGLIMGLFTKKKNHSSTVACIAVLPLLLSPIESEFYVPPSNNLVSTKIIVSAEPEIVWNTLIDVQDIQADELGFSFVHLMGFPQPLKADMNGRGTGTLRVSTWEKNVVFGERITHWNEFELLKYEFEINPDQIPDTALDKHVKLGGRYGAVLNGSYKLKKLGGGKTELELNTLYQNNTSWLSPYVKAWADFILDDFHHSILHLIKVRSEGFHNKMG